jgi:hypothetical protein
MDERTAFFRFSGFTNLIQDQIVPKWRFILVREETGWKGLVAGMCFILPAVLITGCFYLVVQTH